MSQRNNLQSPTMILVKEHVAATMYVCGAGHHVSTAYKLGVSTRVHYTLALR